MVLVSGGAATEPARAVDRDRSVVGAFADVAELVGGLPPHRTVAGAAPGDRVRDLVEENLMDFVVVPVAGEVP